MSSEFVAVAGCWEHVNGYFAAGCHCEGNDSLDSALSLR